MIKARPPAVLKLALKIPILVYRFRLGVLLGRRFLMLSHRGRKSGLERRTVLEVISYTDNPPAAAVLSGWGERSQWFRNLQTSRPIAVSIGGERWRNPECEVLDPERVVEVVEEYRREHRLLVSMLDRFFGWSRKAGKDERRRLERDMRVVVFRPEGSD